MKLIYVANMRLPTEKAHGLQVMNMCKAFAAAGVTVELIVPTRKNPTLAENDPFRYYSIVPNFTISRVVTPDPRWLLRFPPGTYIKVQATLFMIMLTLRLLRLWRAANTVLYTRDEYLLPLLQRFSRTVVWEGHALPRRRRQLAPFFRRCQRLIVLTQQLRREVLDLGVAAERVQVLPDGVDLQIFHTSLTQAQARQQLALPTEAIVLCYTGTFKTKEKDKGLHDIFYALQSLAKRYQKLLFVAVGGSEQDIAEYAKLAAELALTQIVRLLPRVDQSTLVIYQRAATVLLMPFPRTKHYAAYMSPLKMFEYMTSGTPILATQLPTIQEVLNTSNAVLVAPGKPEAIAQGIERILKDAVEAKKLADKALKDVQHYTWEQRARHILSSL